MLQGIARRAARATGTRTTRTPRPRTPGPLEAASSGGWVRLAGLDLPAAPRPDTGDRGRHPGPPGTGTTVPAVHGGPRSSARLVGPGAMDGHFRLQPGRGWQPFEAWQYNSGPGWPRVRHAHRRRRIPTMFGADTYRRPRQDAQHASRPGPGGRRIRAEFDLGELVTWLDDAVLLARDAARPGCAWAPVDDDTFDVVLTDHGRTVTGRVSVDERGRVRDFSTTDRFWALPGLVRAAGPRRCRAGRRPAAGRSRRCAAIWHLPEGPVRVRPGAPGSRLDRVERPADVTRARGRRACAEPGQAGLRAPGSPDRRRSGGTRGVDQDARQVVDGRSGRSTAHDRCAGASGDGHPT